MQWFQKEKDKRVKMYVCIYMYIYLVHTCSYVYIHSHLGGNYFLFKQDFSKQHINFYRVKLDGGVPKLEVAFRNSVRSGGD